MESALNRWRAPRAEDPRWNLVHGTGPPCRSRYPWARTVTTRSAPRGGATCRIPTRC